MVGLDKAILIEQYEKKRMSMIFHAIRKCGNLTILPKLKNFCIRFHQKCSQKNKNILKI